jgi:hypothetical protein
MEPQIGTFHDVATGITVVRELTADEIPKLPKQDYDPIEEPAIVDEPTEEPVADDLVEGEQP